MTDRPHHKRPISSLPPATEDIDLGWEDDDVFDRQTVVPDVPVDQYAAQMMTQDAPPADDFSLPPELPELDGALPPLDDSSGLPPLPSAPPGQDSLPPGLPPEPPPTHSHAVQPRLAPTQEPAPQTARGGVRATDPEPLRPRQPARQPPPEDDDDEPASQQYKGPSIPRSRVEPSGLELQLDMEPPPSSGTALDLVARANPNPEPGRPAIASDAPPQPRVPSGPPPVLTPAHGMRRAAPVDSFDRFDRRPTEGFPDESEEHPSSLPPPVLSEHEPASSRRFEEAAVMPNDAPPPSLDEPGLDTGGDPSSGNPYQDMKDRYAVGDFTGALVIAESLLESDPADGEAQRFAESCREVLTQMYAARLGELDQVVRVIIPSEQIRWLSLDHRAGFLLSLVDGMSSIEDILDVSGMARLDALRIMFQLMQQRVIALE